MSAGRALEALGAVAALVLVYALALGSFAPVDLAIGAVLAVTVVVGLRSLVFTAPDPSAADLLRRAVRLVPYLAIVAREVIVGTASVAADTLRRTPARRGAIIEVPMGERTDFGIAVTGLAISLTPGEVVVDLDWDRRVMFVHALDGSNPDRIRADQQRIYERYQRPVFP